MICLLLALLSIQDPPRSSQQNILILIADDLGVDQIGAYGVGQDLPPTPNLDALAAQGVLFRTAWSNPVCAPTRATILTGRYSFRTGIGNVEWFNEYPLPLEEVTIPEMLDQGTAGQYEHAAIGKWHLGRRASVGGDSAPNVMGFGHFDGVMANFLPPDDFYSHRKVANGTAFINQTYAPTDKVDSALAWIAQTQGPWLCYVAFNTPHNPWHAPPQELHTQDLSGAGDPETNSRPYYKAMVEAMDTEIGRLLSSLGPELDNTTIIFLGDNGSPGGGTVVAPFDPARSKGTLYEGGVNVPLIIRSPLVSNPGSETAALVHTADLWATVAELAGVDPKGILPADVNLDSVSMVPYLLDSAAPSVRSTLFAERFHPPGAEGGLGGPPEPPGPCDCQEDVGFSGPGTAVLSLCGDFLDENDRPYLLLAGAPPLQTGLLYVSVFLDPQPMFGGLLTPNPPTFLQLFFTDAAGEARVTNYPAIETAFFQMVVNDPGQPGGFSLSNTVRGVFPSNEKAVRNARFKLIVDHYGIKPDQFFDLLNDPFELVELLGRGPLGPEEQANYDSLKAELVTLLGSEPRILRKTKNPQRAWLPEPCPPGR